MPVTKVLGVNINYEDIGDGYPILLMHGFSSNLQSWDEQVPALQDKYRVVRFDSRGHGGSESPDDPAEYSQEILVEEALHLMDTLHLDKVNACGLSMGGNVALNLAIHHPDRVHAAIIASTGAGSSADDGFINEFKILTDMLDKGDLASFTEALMASPLSATFQKLRPDLVEYTKERAKSNNSRGLANTIRGVQMKRNSILTLKDKLKNLDVPSLVVVGEYDAPCVEPANFMGRHIPRSYLAVFPETGHIVNQERPEDFNRAMINFLNDVESGDI